ncbi:MAG: D-glycerate dehydrogenase [Burkholderiaceae bacterium]|jgi:gluconate 2-dehydrogenase
MDNPQKKPRVLVTRAVFAEHLERLAAFCEVDSNQSDVSLGANELRQRLAGAAAALITGGDRIDAAALADAAELRAVCSISVGYNHIDLAACTAARVMATNTPDVLTETTADLGFALLMAAARRVTASERWLREGHWQRWALDQWLGFDLHHSTLGIIGMGRIGQAIARRARGFSMRVIYHNRRPLAAQVEHDLQAHYVTKEELLQQADHVVLVVPFTPETRHLIGAPELALMKPTATLTNIARGGLIDEVALCTALRSGRLGAAGLDVFEGEPRILPDLLTLNNVALTPHIGSASRPTRDAMVQLAIDNLESVLAGLTPPCLLNTDVLDRKR